MRTPYYKAKAQLFVCLYILNKVADSLHFLNIFIRHLYIKFIFHTLITLTGKDNKNYRVLNLCHRNIGTKIETCRSRVRPDFI